MAQHHKISVKQSLSYGFDLAKENIRFFVLLLLFYVALTTVPRFLSDFFEQNEVGILVFICAIAGTIIQMGANLGLVAIALKITDGKKADYSDLLSYVSYLIPFFLSSLLYTLLVTVGLLLFIVPGIIWGIKFQYFPYAIIEKNMGPIGALKESSRITKGHKWVLFQLSTICFFINLLGILTLGIGLFITLPTTMIAGAYVYRKLEGE